MPAGKIIHYGNHSILTTHTVQTAAHYVVHLACKCNVDTPYWTVERLNPSHSFTKTSDVLCHSDTNDGCSDTALPSVSSTKYVYNEIPQHIVNGTTIFKCHTSDGERFAEPLIVLVEEEPACKYNVT